MHIVVIKVGGEVLQDAPALESFLKRFVQIKVPKVLVHGGGRSGDFLLEKLQIEPQFIDGRRVTDRPTLEALIDVYSGLNRNLVARLQNLDQPSIGVCGADCGGLLQARKRPVSKVDYGFVGDVSAVHVEPLRFFLQKSWVPVLGPLTYDTDLKTLLNTNADTIACEVARSLAKVVKVELIYSFALNGVFDGPPDYGGQLLESLNAAEISTLIQEKKVVGGMIPKLHNSLRALEGGVQSVSIGKADQLDISGKLALGTRITLD